MTIGDSIFGSVCVLCASFLLWRFARYMGEL